MWNTDATCSGSISITSDPITFSTRHSAIGQINAILDIFRMYYVGQIEDRVY